MDKGIIPKLDWIINNGVKFNDICVFIEIE